MREYPRLQKSGDIFVVTQRHQPKSVVLPYSDKLVARLTEMLEDIELTELGKQALKESAVGKTKSHKEVKALFGLK